MEGSIAKQEEYGVIPRSAHAIFEQLTREDLKYESFNVHCSYLEIYNEDLMDLLAEEGSNNQSSNPHQKLEIMEGKNGPFCRGLLEKEVTSAADVLLLMQKAQQQKKVGETNMNKSSSRSHCIFTIRVHAKRRLDDGALFESKGKLHMVDLAGSECAKTANLEDGSGHEQVARERERMNINRSLLTLGRVVKNLKEQSTSKKKGSVRIPYRDSKLTRILQNALGGNSKTCIIATLSPSETAIEESISTLNYAQAAHGIINKPLAASYMSQATTSSSMLAGIDPSKGNNNAAVTIEHWDAMQCRLQYMESQMEEAKAALARKHLQQQELVERAEKAEADKSRIEQQLQESEKENETLKEELSVEKEKREVAEKELLDTKTQLERTSAVLQATQQTEAALTTEATALIDALKKSTADTDNMYHIILANRESDIQRKKAANEFNVQVVALLTSVEKALTVISEQQTKFTSQSLEMVSAHANKEREFVEKTKVVTETALDSVHHAVISMEACMEDAGGVIPTIDEMQNSLAVNLEQMKNTMESGEQVLLQQFASTREKLQEFSTSLKDIQQSHGETTTQTINLLETHVNQSKENVKSLISSTSKTIEHLRDERKKVRETTNAVLQEWKSRSIKGNGAILVQSLDQIKSVEDVQGKLTSEMQRHDNIASHLGDQLALLQNSQTASASHLESQKSYLVESQTKLNESHKKQNEALSAFVKNILQGVEQLVQSQMEEVLKESSKSHASLKESGSFLIENHSKIASATLETLQNAESLSSTIKKEAEAVKENDSNVISYLGETKAVFAKLENVAKTQTESVEKFSSNAFEGMEAFERLETDDTNAVETLASMGDQCANHLSEKVLKTTRDQINDLSKSGEGIATFTRETVLPSLSSAVDEMEQPRGEVIAEIRQNVTTSQESVTESSSLIKQKAADARKAAEDLNEDISSAGNKFLRETVESRNADIEKTKEHLLRSTKEHEDGVRHTISGTQGDTNKVATTVDVFVTDELSAKEEVDAAPAFAPVTFSEELSSTPSEEEILKTVEKSNTVTDLSLEIGDGSESQSSRRSSLGTIDGESSNSEECKPKDGSSVLQNISPNEDSSAKKRSRKSISSTPVKQSPSPARKVPSRRPSKLALPKATSSFKRARR